MRWSDFRNLLPWNHPPVAVGEIDEAIAANRAATDEAAKTATGVKVGLAQQKHEAEVMLAVIQTRIEYHRPPHAIISAVSGVLKTLER